MSAMLCVILTLLLCTTLIAETYSLSVGEKLYFNYFVAGLPFQGEFMVSDSKFELNFDYPEKSTFMVQFDIKQSNAGFPAATKAMLSKRGLDASQFPLARFKSIDVVSENEKFEILGNLQIKMYLNQ
jgi:polyisoprenoid-binding protein YceI